MIENIEVELSPLHSPPPLLEIENLSISFGDHNVIDGVSLSLERGEILGLVGESGCGKSVTAMSILQLLPRPLAQIRSGRILFSPSNDAAAPIDLLSLSPSELQRLRGERIAVIFQEPSTTLNPLRTIGEQLFELFDYHPDRVSRSEERERVLSMLRSTGFPDPARIITAYPHELSGGMQQRVVIAQALLLDPELVIADEPTTALDVTVQAQVMELLGRLQRESGSAVLLITHNLNLVAQYADNVAVMYAGRVVEKSPVVNFLKRPLHPYSEGLLAALPSGVGVGGRGLVPIPGQVPPPERYQIGCRFRDRCPRAVELCHQRPDLIYVSKLHQVACFAVHGVGEEGSDVT